LGSGEAIPQASVHPGSTRQDLQPIRVLRGRVHDLHAEARDAIAAGPAL
jgi:hypothetical protein